MAGFFVHFLIHIFVSHIIQENTGVLMSGFSVGFMGVYVFCAVLFVGLASGILPARQVYKADLSENLKHHT
jgi:ABC-type antimicrobial peptide transport system permease subunit